MQIAQNEQWQRGDWEYSWNANGSLKSVKLPDGNLVEYEYDALGRRTKKIFNNKIIRYLWDNNVLLHEWEYDKTEAPRRVVNKLGEVSFDKPEPINNLITWVYETNSFVPCAKITENGIYSIINDYIGRPIQAYDNNGKLVWQTDYDIYGNLRNLKGEKDFIPFRQLGQYEDIETGLYYNRFRYYDPNTGTYISKDPISILGGLNVYAYVKDINAWVDILGLNCIKKANSNQKQLIEKLRNGEDVSVKSIKEARDLLNLMPDLRPHINKYPKWSHSANIEANKFGDLWKQPKGTYRGDLFPLTEDLFNKNIIHQSNDILHDTLPHYNIRFNNGIKAAILITG